MYLFSYEMSIFSHFHLESTRKITVVDYFIFLEGLKKPDRNSVKSKHTRGERAWVTIGDRLQRPCYLSRGDHDKKIRSRKQRIDIGKYSFVNRTPRLWKHLPADAFGTPSCKPSNFRKKVRKIINEAK
jgi:hypothetical protein